MKNIRIFGPVPSRRLGKSIGINNIPPKKCSYSCVYCQLGVSFKMEADRRQFYDPYDLLEEVREKIANARSKDEPIDYLTIVPDGEPTLDVHLGELIDLLKPLGSKVAIITNATLLADPRVREELGKADWVSVKVDTVDENIWRKIDRPHKQIDFKAMLEGVQAFSREYAGFLATETMLVDGLNCDVEAVAAFIREMHPAKAYLSIPTRPPAVKWVQAPQENGINKAFQTLMNHSIDVEYLIGYEGDAFAYTGDMENDLLSITSVHPMREDAVKEYLKKAGGSFSIIEKLLSENRMIVTEYNDDRFYLRKLQK